MTDNLAAADGHTIVDAVRRGWCLSRAESWNPGSRTPLCLHVIVCHRGFIGLEVAHLASARGWRNWYRSRASLNRRTKSTNRVQSADASHDRGVTPTVPGLMDDAEPQLSSLRSASDGSCLRLVVFGGHRSLSEWSVDQWTVSPW